jgi:enoyl-[acyl-carrier protein] reductase I
MSYQLLKGKTGIITGALDENSIAWKVAEKAHEEGARFVLTNAPIAMRMGEIKKLAEKTGSEIIPADATSTEELTHLFTRSQEILGGKIDFVLHSIGMSVNIRKKIPYTELNYEYYQKGLDVSALSLHKMLAVAMKLDAINEWGSVVALTYMAAQRTFPFYTDMADIKAMLESIARSFGYHYGVTKKVRINTVSQSPTKTPEPVSRASVIFSIMLSPSPHSVMPVLKIALIIVSLCSLILPGWSPCKIFSMTEDIPIQG